MQRFSLLGFFRATFGSRNERKTCHWQVFLGCMRLQAYFSVVAVSLDGLILMPGPMVVEMVIVFR
jgi:hypothetical protein